MTINCDRTFCNVVKTRQQIDNRGFAGTGRTNQRNGAAWLNMQINQIENIATVRLVTENYIVEIDASFTSSVSKIRSRYAEQVIS